MATPIPDFLVLSPQLASKLASVVVHAQEMMSPQGHPFDKQALEVLARDPEIMDWIERMGPLAPRRR